MGHHDRDENDDSRRAALPGTPEHLRDWRQAQMFAAEVAKRLDIFGPAGEVRDWEQARMIAEEIEQVRRENTPGTPEYERARRHRELEEAALRERRKLAEAALRERQEAEELELYHRQMRETERLWTDTTNGSPTTGTPNGSPEASVIFVLVLLGLAAFLLTLSFLSTDDMVSSYSRVASLVIVLGLILGGLTFGALHG